MKTINKSSMKKVFKKLVIFILSLTFIKCSSQKESVNENWGGGIDCNYPSISQNLKGPIKRIIQYKVINRTGRPEERMYKAFFSWGEHDHGYILAQGVLQYDKKGLIPGSYKMYGNGENDIEYDESGRKSCNLWPGVFEPGLSSFHPSAMILAKKLRDSIKVKRELQSEQLKKEANVDIFESFWGGEEEKKDDKKEEKIEQIELKENYLVHLVASLEYYLSVNNPILGLVYYINHKESNEPIKSINFNFFRKNNFFFC